MTTEYRIIFSMTFDNAEDRDVWYSKVKTSILNAKVSSAAYKRADLTKDDYFISEKSSEQIV